MELAWFSSATFALALLFGTCLDVSSFSTDVFEVSGSS